MVCSLPRDNPSPRRLVDCAQTSLFPLPLPPFHNRGERTQHCSPPSSLSLRPTNRRDKFVSLPDLLYIMACLREIRLSPKSFSISLLGAKKRALRIAFPRSQRPPRGQSGNLRGFEGRRHSLVWPAQITVFFLNFTPKAKYSILASWFSYTPPPIAALSKAVFLS